MNNPFDYIPDTPCDKAFRELISKIETLKMSHHPDHINFCRELEAGKMLGVLIATDSLGTTHILYAFSGQLGKGGFHHLGFVEPVFDYLQPDGHFKTKETEISRQNRDILIFENETLAGIKKDYEGIKENLDSKISEFKEKCRLSKLERDRKRSAGVTDESELAEMIRQSQFEKAELHRLKKRIAAELQPYLDRLTKAEADLEAMKRKRHDDSEALQTWLFSNFRLLNANGESRSLQEIFADTPMRIPPSGAGECCAPKLLQAAYKRGLHPISMAEYWYGAPKEGEVRRDGEHYPACRGKCLPVLSWMLQGLEITPPLDNEYHSSIPQEPEILYENQWFCVVNKPSGMLSVPGKGTAVSVQEWLTNRYGDNRIVKMAHRLDQDTSGLLIATFGELSFKVMQSLFSTRRVKKTYIADLDGDYESLGKSECGRIELPLSPDFLDRPRQRVDLKDGKEAITEYEFTDTSDGRSRVVFHPLTGRTHQLRVHAASELGLGMPIAGDRLYGRNGGKGVARLHLHARKIEFQFPIDKQHYTFESPTPF